MINELILFYVLRVFSKFIIGVHDVVKTPWGAPFLGFIAFLFTNFFEIFSFGGLFYTSIPPQALSLYLINESASMSWPSCNVAPFFVVGQFLEPRGHVRDVGHLPDVVPHRLAGIRSRRRQTLPTTEAVCPSCACRRRTARLNKKIIQSP